MEAKRTSTPVVCNGCLTLIDPEWERIVSIDQYSFHTRCAPVCSVCDQALERDESGQVTTCMVLDSRVQFVSPRGYHVQLKVCCCSDCYTRALHDEPSALA